VLVVDDEPVARDVVTKYLCADDHEVVVATAAVEALEQLKQGVFDLVITDHAMPQMNGAQLARLIKSNGRATGVDADGLFRPALPRDTLPPTVDLMLPKPISSKISETRLQNCCLLDQVALLRKVE